MQEEVHINQTEKFEPALKKDLYRLYTVRRGGAGGPVQITGHSGQQEGPLMLHTFLSLSVVSLFVVCTN
jgi:hypothetical protein